MADAGWPADFPIDGDGGVEEGITVLSRSLGIEGRSTGSRRRCTSRTCPGWFIGVRWETGQLMYVCSEGWTYDRASNTVRITGGGEISARIVSPPPLGPPPRPKEQWPTPSTLRRWKGWRTAEP